MTSKNDFYDLVSIVIRSAGERTEGLCRELVLAQGFSPENVTTVGRTPFPITLRDSYQAGIAMNRPWTLCLDADVLLLSDSIQYMLKIAINEKSSISVFQFLVIDKFFGGPREAGNHLYRTSLLSKALECLPDDPGVIRPETATIEAMKQQGFPKKRVNFLIGLHDFEQSFKDIFRKCFIQAHKHQEYAEIPVTYWPEAKNEDEDFKIALKGFTDGLSFDGEVNVDAQQEIYSKLFGKLQLNEKTPLHEGFFTLSDINELADNWKSPPVYDKYFHYDLISNHNTLSSPIDNLKRAFDKKRYLGGIKLILYTIGWFIEAVGRKVKFLVDRK